MGGALLRGWARHKLSPVIAVEPTPSDELTAFAKKHHIALFKSASSIASLRARACVVALKPQILKHEIATLAPIAQSGALMLSIAAGTSIKSMKAAWGRESRIVRAMPNTPGAIGRGITALYADKGATPADATLAGKLLDALGETVWVDREADIDAVTAVSGSGPAYVFLMVEALADAAHAEGLPRPRQGTRFVILYRTYKPPPPLDAFIDNLWYWEGSDPGYAKDAILASSTIGLLINLRYDELSAFSGDGYADEHRLRGIGFSGTHATPFAIRAHQPHMMGMQFKPGGAWPFLKPGGDALHDRHVSLEDIWGTDAERLHQRLVQAPTPDDKFAILLHAFVAKAPRDFAHDPAVALALGCFTRAPHRATVAGVARRAEVSQKKLIRLFRESVGMTPKLFLRVTRFQRVIADLHARRAIGWGDVVEQHGYYDQSHFIRDFREFSGFSPTGWLKQRNVAMLTHVPLPD